MINTLVTVIIPNYNHQDYLEARIESVLNQTFQDFQLYILDDNSSDNSLTIINKYKENKKIKDIIVNPINSGSVFKQWYKAFELANTKYLWIAESDDFAHEDFLMETVAVLEKKERLGFVFTDSTVVNHENKIIQPAPFNTITNLHSNIDELTFYNKDLMDVGRFLINQLLVINVSSVLFRAEALKTIDKEYFGNFKNAGDLFTYLHIIFNWDIAFIKKPLNYYRLHDNNTTKSNNRSGTLHLDRINLVTYYFDQLVKLSDAPFFLTSFLKRHYLPALDHNHQKHLKRLLKCFKNHDMLSRGHLMKLESLASLSKLFNIKKRLWFRNKVKALLKQI